MQPLIDATQIAKPELESMFEKLDDNKNGLIEYSEFITAIMARELILCKESLRKAFNTLDYNQDGFIDVDELSRAFRGVNKED